MNSLSKSSVFRILRLMVKKGNMNGFEHVQSAFDESIQHSLQMVYKHVCRKHRSTKTPSPPVSSAKPKTLETLYKDLGISEVNVDRLKPYDIVVAFQALALHAKLATNSLNKNDAFHRRFHSLLAMSQNILDEFTFIKLSLMLNSITNILNTGVLDLNNKTPLPLGNNRQDMELPDIAVSFKSFHKDVVIHILLKLWTSPGEAGEYAIDIHSVCMVLKYFAATREIDVDLVYMLHKFLSTQNKVDFMDQINIVTSLSYANLLGESLTCDDRRVINRISSTELLSKMDQSTRTAIHKAKEAMNKENANINVVTNPVDAILQHLCKIDGYGFVPFDVIKMYLGSVVRLSIRRIHDKEILRTHALRAISMISDALSTKSNISPAAYASLYDSIDVLWGETNIIDAQEAVSFLFTRQNLSLFYKVFTEINESHTSKHLKPIAQISALLNRFCNANDCMDDKQQQWLKGLVMTASKVITKALDNSDPVELTVLDIVNMASKYNGENAHKSFEKLLFNIYASIPKSVSASMQVLKHTSTLFQHLSKVQWILPHGLLCAISRFICETYAEVFKVNPRVILRLLSNLSILYRQGHRLPIVTIIKDPMNLSMEHFGADEYFFKLDILYNFVHDTGVVISDIVNVELVAAMLARASVSLEEKAAMNEMTEEEYKRAMEKMKFLQEVIKTACGD